MTKPNERLSLEPVEISLRRLLAALNADDDGELDVTRVDKITRALENNLRTLENMRRHQREEDARLANEQYTTFENLKMPPPEERERMIAELNRHFGVTDKREGRDDG